MSSAFWLGVAQTAIGSGLGFVVGIGAFHYQQGRQSTKKKCEDWRSALDALNRLNIAAGANIEVLANAKLQLISALRADVEKMKPAVEDWYDTPVSERAKKVPEIKNLSESMLHFYRSLPRISVMHPPSSFEYSQLSKDMPALTIFVHRAVSCMEEINEHIVSRNALIAEYAREGGTGTGMSSERLIYFSSMLASTGEAMSESTEFALDFWRLVLDQVKAYMTTKARSETFLDCHIAPKAIEVMPKNELFPEMRRQLKTFDR